VLFARDVLADLMGVEGLEGESLDGALDSYEVMETSIQAVCASKIGTSQERLAKVRDLVKVIRFGLEKAGVKVRRCQDPHHLSVEWRGVLKKSTVTQSSGARTTLSTQKHAAADGGPRFIFDGDRGTVPMLNVLMNPAKCKPDYICKNGAIDVTG
jgi:hypothetical protein